MGVIVSAAPSRRHMCVRPCVWRVLCLFLFRFYFALQKLYFKHVLILLLSAAVLPIKYSFIYCFSGILFLAKRHHTIYPQQKRWKATNKQLAHTKQNYSTHEKKEIISRDDSFLHTCIHAAAFIIQYTFIKISRPIRIFFLFACLCVWVYIVSFVVHLKTPFSVMWSWMSWMEFFLRLSYKLLQFHYNLFSVIVVDR